MLITHLMRYKLDSGKKYSTIDHIFILHVIAEILKYHKKKSYCIFIDFKSAFDAVCRTCLWRTLIKSGINGNVLTVIKNMYANAK